MIPRTERNRRRDQTARLPGHWRKLGPSRDQRPEVPWSGMCPAGKHGLDYEGQDCDVCRHDSGGPCERNCRRCAVDVRRGVTSGWYPR